MAASAKHGEAGPHAAKGLGNVIAAIGLTPAWQHILSLGEVRRGEVNRLTAAEWCASGKVLNVGLALRRLGAPCLTVAPLGGLPRTAIAAEFASLGAAAVWLPVAQPTRVCTTILELGCNRTTELVENASPMTAAELAEFALMAASAARHAQYMVLTGSLPNTAPSDYYRHLLEMLPARAIVDARGPELLAALPARPLLVKPNRDELAATAGEPLDTDDALRAAMRTMREMGANWVAVTDGDKPAWAIGPEGEFRLTPPTVEVVNPIGCGDCMTAGIADALARGKTMLEALQWGMGAAADNLGERRPARLDPQRVAKFAQRVVVAAA